VQGVPIGSTLLLLSIKEAKVVSAGAQDISQAFAIPEIVVKVRRTLKETCN